MKYIIITIALLFSFNSNSQTIGRLDKGGIHFDSIPSGFVEASYHNFGLFKKKIIVWVDYGQRIKSFKPNNTLLYPNGKEYEFRSAMHLLRYFNERGYEFIERGQYTLPYNTIINTYLFKKI